MLRLIADLLRPYRTSIAVIVMSMAMQTATSLAAPWPLKAILDNVVGNHPPPAWISWCLPLLGGEGKGQIAAAAGLATVAIAVVSGCAFYVSNYATEMLGQRVANDLRVRTFHRLQLFSLAFFDQNRVGTLLSTIMTDVQTIQNFASVSTLNIVTDTVTIIGMVVVMLLLRLDFALIAIAVVPFLAVFVWRVNAMIRSATRDVRARQSDLMSTLQEGLEAVEVVQAFDRQDVEEQQLVRASQETIGAWLRARRVSALLSPIVGLAVALCTGLVLWRGGLLIVSGVMTAGTLTVFLSYLAKFFQPIRELAVMSNSIAAVSVAFERVKAILDADYVVPERPNAKKPPAFEGAIAFDRVTFGYDKDAPVLRDITFRVDPGQTVGIVGPTGSGKSTVVSLLPRFRDTDSGTIQIDGVNVCDYQLHPMREQIGFVLQDTVLFRGTISENIAFGRPGATHDEVVAAAKLANAHEFIERMPHGYDSAVGERGLTLSGGQRQRIGIARAFIRDSPILILDEPTAALDAEAEATVMEGLDRLTQGKTVIIIAHRLSTIRNADVILVVDEGVVTERGSHRDLMALKDGTYARMYRLQVGEQAADC
ncbi:ABC transporter ATP-binding protein [Mycobacterium yunnanensis]|uniref:Fatty acid ABC transporter ATP-binding/permease protein n=1 Tax=Mycobacterium yunnanensis TaxID=368477 RepID=A0A9X3BW40_9MYCO|nr:ABC transporter ATP-binding protein [Mycobacterium yunnanensis]MCV7424294.1 ABC transporter ATP-binding protein [Mycobacterium yunnanensis]